MKQISNSIVLLSGWRIDCCCGKNYINYTHYIYLKEMIKYYDEIVLIVPFRSIDILSEERNIFLDLKVKIEPLPYFDKYSQGMKYFFNYYKAIKKYDRISLFYCRFPSPYAWMPKILFNKRCIIDYVGDPIVENFANKNKNIFVKCIKAFMFIPEYSLILIASKFSKVTTRGEHIKLKLKKYGILAKSIISSTILENELYEKSVNLDKKEFSLVYLGYLRYPKGIMIFPEIIKNLLNKNYRIHLNIIGDGEAKESLMNEFKKLNLAHIVTFHGHLDNRRKILKILRDSDLFIFPSNAEGSPRVILESMANSCLVISTPVGSLPYHFKDKESILFANFNDEQSFTNQIEFAMNNIEKSNLIIKNAYNKIKQKYLMKDFIKKVFTYET